MTNDLVSLADFYNQSHLIYIDDEDEKIHSGTEGVAYVTVFEWQKLDEKSKTNFSTHLAEVIAYEDCLEIIEPIEKSKWVSDKKVPIAIISAESCVKAGKVHLPEKFDIVVIQNLTGKKAFEIYRWGDPPEDVVSLGSTDAKVLATLRLNKVGQKRTQTKIKVAEERAAQERAKPINLKKAIQTEIQEKTGELDLNDLLGAQGFPKELWGLTHLKKLNLRYGKQHVLPPEIGNLEKLEELELNGNYFETLPDEIGKLKQLRVLTAQLNSLKALPASFENLQNLEVLNLYGCAIERLPPFVGKLKKLKVLDVGFGRTKFLPKELADLPLLEELRVSGLDLENVPEEIADEGTTAILRHLKN